MFQANAFVPKLQQFEAIRPYTIKIGMNGTPRAILAGTSEQRLNRGTTFDPTEASAGISMAYEWEPTARRVALEKHGNDFFSLLEIFTLPATSPFITNVAREFLDYADIH
jgi:hypothetical protein